MNSDNKETVILEQLAHNETPVRQRELAEVAGLSLGMTNGLLKKMTDKGLLLMEKVNSRKIKYVLTAAGMAELNRRTRNYMKKTIRNVVYYREAVEKLVARVAGEGYENVVLMGKSDLDFILEWACSRYHVHYNCDPEKYKTYTVYSEKGTLPQGKSEKNSETYLINI